MIEQAQAELHERPRAPQRLPGRLRVPDRGRLLALDFKLGSPKELVIVTAGPRSKAEPFLSVLRRTYLPNKVLVVASKGKNLKAQSELVPLVKGKVGRKGQTTAYVCEQGVCQLPTTDVEVFTKQLQQNTPPPPTPPAQEAAAGVR